MLSYPNVSVQNMELTPCQVFFKSKVIALTGDTTSADATVTGLASTANLFVGMAVSGAGIPANATILSITNSTTIELSANATATATGVALSFGGTKVDLGGTLGGVKIKVQYKKSPIKADQFGDTDLDSKVSGFMATVETELTQVRDFQILKVLFPHATLVGDASKAILFNTAVGDADSDNAGELTLHPQSVGSNDETYDWLVYKAVATAESEYPFSPTEQTKLKITWKVYPDLSVNPARFLRYGDKDIV